MNGNFNRPSWSQGAAYADLDNDGDMDIIINNMSETAEIYKNNANEMNIGNYINIILQGPKNNPKGIGARIKIEYDRNQQIFEVNPVRGYMSTSEVITHFGLGNANEINQLSVLWPGGNISVLGNVKA